MGSRAAGRAIRLLIVEDSGPFRGALRDAIRSRFPGVAVLEAENLAQGRRMARENSPDVVFLDISLPDGNGLDLAEALQRESPETAVAVCSSYGLPEYRAEASRRGARHFFWKEDLDWEGIGDLVEEEIDRREGAGAAAG